MTRILAALPLTLALGIATLGPVGCSLAAPATPAYVAYPPDGHHLSHSHVLLEGSVDPGSRLRINGRPVLVGADGLFILWWPLEMGKNQLTLETLKGSAPARQHLNIYRVPPGSRATPYQPLPPRPVEVQRTETLPGINTVEDAWEDDAGKPALYAQLGARALQVGQKGNLARLKLPNGEEVWGSSNTLRPSAPLPRAVLAGPPRTTQLPAALEIRLPITARVPFKVQEDPQSQSLRVDLLGAKPLGIWQETALPALKFTETDAGSALTVSLQRPLHGYTLNYAQSGGSDELVIRLKEAPAAGPLAGRRIVLDAGHGGTEEGGAGPLRVAEKDLVLPITLRAAELLRAKGAEVILTREDDRTVPIYERPRLAARAQADVLISVHANAIPDGIDPRTRRGISAFYTHPLAQPLAQTLLNALLTGLPEVGDDGLRGGANLALTRPTTQPSVLLELGYLTDPGNLRLLMSQAGEERYAQAIAQGLERYFAELPE